MATLPQIVWLIFPCVPKPFVGISPQRPKIICLALTPMSQKDRSGIHPECFKIKNSPKCLQKSSVWRSPQCHKTIGKGFTHNASKSGTRQNALKNQPSGICLTFLDRPPLSHERSNYDHEQSSALNTLTT